MGKRYTPSFGGNPRSLIGIGTASKEASLLADCTTANIPADASAGYMGGAVLMVTDAATGVSAMYQNTGSITSCAFRPVHVSSGLTDTAALTATNAEINSVVHGNTATAAEITRNAAASTRLVATTATQVSVTAAAHGERDLVLTSTHTTTVTLPAASGSGNRYNIIVGVTGTDGSKIVQVANTTDVIQGASIAANTQSTTIGFISTSGSDTITLNNTTTGGLLGTRITIVDVAAGTFLANVFNITTGNPATPFSNAV